MVTEAAPAKLNLYLQLVGRRDDGYHLLDSLVAFTEYGDSVSVAAATGFTLTIDGPFAAALADTGDDNIVLRAARGLAQMAGVAGGAAIRLTKRLPVASGIGGGSTDAAATLRALTRLWGLTLSAGQLSALALSLGADVPVCLAARPALMGGIGETLAPVAPLPPVWVVLVNPGIALATPAVFKARHGAFTSAPAPWPSSALADADALATALAARHNDLTAPAVGLAPVIAEVLAELAAQPGCLLARMSGSGATSFALFATGPEAEAAASHLGHHHPDWWILPTRLRTAS